MELDACIHNIYVPDANVPRAIRLTLAHTREPRCSLQMTRIVSDPGIVEFELRFHLTVGILLSALRLLPFSQVYVYIDINLP